MARERGSLTVSLLVLLLLLLIATERLADAAKILAIFPVPLKQHQLVYQPLIEELAYRGHDIVLVTTDPMDLQRSNGTHQLADRIEQIDLSFAYQLPVLEQLNVDGLDGRDMLRKVFDVMRTISAEELQHPAMQKLIKAASRSGADGSTPPSNKCIRFDVVIVEWSGVTLMNAFAEHFRAPLIGIANGGAFINAHEAVGNPNHPIGYPSIFMPFSEDLSLLQRISSVLFTVWYRFYYYTEEIPAQNAIAISNFGDTISDLRQIEQNADLLLINCHQVLGNVRPVGPTTVHLGGIHQRASVRPLPDELALFLEQSDAPIAYVNLAAPSGGLAGRARIEKLVKTLEQLEVASVWSLNENSVPINTSARIYQSYSVPQEDVLAHPKVRLFITDGGQINIEDAIQHRVPVVGISYSTSYEHYLRQIAKYEAGVISLIDFEPQSTFMDKLRDVFTIERYQDNINRLQRLVNDQPQTSMERAVWWIEYVARNGGAQQLRVRQLSWFEYLMIDVLLTVAILASLFGCAVGYLIFRAVRYSKSLPTEMVTRGSRKCKLL
ncbi:UDP-glucosyltransferase 2-like [Anopheles aquasalis]|uniref:UDP-glucosyltransferase 2-like n=1 Tax=Anopheles aquasalis TaxID=42839 RepID=UPI00215A8393|nr:UDP-glucosyltransferase 2-like [Anopheles aquasalis]